MHCQPRLIAIVTLILVAPAASAQVKGVAIGSPTTAELKGAATLFQLRIPFGGREQERGRATVTLNAGPVFQEQSDASYLRGTYYNTPSVQAGYSLEGDPVLKVGSTDIAKKNVRSRPQARSLLGFFLR